MKGISEKSLREELTRLERRILERPQTDQELVSLSGSILTVKKFLRKLEYVSGKAGERENTIKGKCPSSAQSCAESGSSSAPEKKCSATDVAGTSSVARREEKQ